VLQKRVLQLSFGSQPKLLVTTLGSSGCFPKFMGYLPNLVLWYFRHRCLSLFSLPHPEPDGSTPGSDLQ
jgi:hypothetical protein